MGGWIKLEKDLREDFRVRRMAASLCNAPALQGVTLVLGGLVQLWMHADSFARDDDTLDITLDEIDQLTGIHGFAKLMPTDWLEVIDSKTVKLPGFQAHNGTDAKRKALTAKRVTHHRDKLKRTSVTPTTQSCNASALPDQDQTKTYTKTLSRDLAAAPPERKRVSRGAVTESERLDFKLAYPERNGDQKWHDAWRAMQARFREGHTFEEILAGAQRYAAHCAAAGKTGTEYVKQAATFVGPGKPFQLPWHPPPKAETASERILRKLNGTDDDSVIEHEAQEPRAISHG